MNDGQMKSRGERFALHAFGSQHIVPGASAAARAVFEACGGAVGWKHWIIPDGKLIRTALMALAKSIDDHPDAPAETGYADLREFPSFIGDHVPWPEAPMQVRGAYEAFRSVYLQLWIMVRTHDETMARALPPRPLPRLVGNEPVKRSPCAPKINDAEAAELRLRLHELGFSDTEIRFRLTEHCVIPHTRQTILEDAEEDACFRAWSTEQAKAAKGGFTSFPAHELSPERPYLLEAYERWRARYAHRSIGGTDGR